MLYLVRHGEAACKKGTCIGQTDIPLTQKGYAGIVQKTLPHLLAQQFDQPTLLASPLLRTMQTAHILAEGLRVSITEESALKEINMGSWDGVPFQTIKERFPDEYQKRGADFANFRPPHGESFFDVQQRVLNVVLPLCRMVEPVILITHAGVIRTLLCAVNSTPLQNLFDYKPATGSITVLSKNTLATNASCLI